MKIGSTIANTISCFCVAGVLSVPVFAGDGGAGATECSYKQAQDSMLRFNNVMQELNLEIVKLQAAGKPIPESLQGTSKNLPHSTGSPVIASSNH
jgi:hypothetical protein